MLLLVTGCTSAEKKGDFAALIRSSTKARSIGHEDLAANDLKEAFDSLPSKGDPKREPAVNELHSQLIILAAELRKSGRLSLSNTIYDLAIQIERECTTSEKPSATALKKMTEKVFDIEENIITSVSTNSDLRLKEKQLAATTKRLNDLFQKGDFQKIETEASTHLERVRTASGTASDTYVQARKVILDIFAMQEKLPSAMALLNRDVKELENFNKKDLDNAEPFAIENAYFLITALSLTAKLQLLSGDFDDSENNARKSFELAKKLGGRMVVEGADGQMTLAEVLRKRGRSSDALALTRSAQKLLKSAILKPEVQIRCLQLIASLENELGQEESARKDFSTLAHYAAGYPRVNVSAVAFASAASYYLSHGDEIGYRRLKDRALKAIQSKTMSRSDAQKVFETLGDGSFKISKFSEAASFYKKALPYSSSYQREVLTKKIEGCKNK